MIIRILKLIISIIFAIFSKIKFALLKILNIKIHPTFVILYYHSVFEREKSNFERQMKLLKELTIPVNLEKEIKLDPNKNYSAVTFDDGFKNVMENALPILDKYNIPATMFCLASNFGEAPIWEYDPVTQDKFECIMTKDEIKNLPLKTFNIGSHSVTHAKLNKVSSEKLKYELTESKKILEQLLERNVKLFSFPNGEYNRQSIDEAMNAGYEKIFTIDPMLSNQNEKVFGRFNADPSDWLIEFRLKLLGYYKWMMLVKKIKCLLKK